MPTFKYQAALPTGVSIFGTFDATDEAGLASYLQSRKMTLVSATELSINTALTQTQKEFPRLIQLRVGDRLREALLTDMPAHEAVRAVACEPFEHPVLMTMPWLFSLAVLGAAALAGAAWFLPDTRMPLMISSMLVPAAVILLWLLSWQWLVQRPRRMLLAMARRLEQGEQGELTGLGMVSSELRAVMNSELNSKTKAISVAELVPTISGIQLQSHQFAARILAPVLALSVLLVGLYVLLLFIVPQFAEIFIGFGVSVPWLTQSLMDLSQFSQKLGFPGLFGFIGFSVGFMVTLYWMMVSPRMAEIWESIPGLGLSIRWLMQARVARILGVLIRNQASPAEAISVAAKASGFRSVAADGERVAEVIRSGTPELAYTRQLSGLPLSLLFRVSGRESEPSRQETAQSFLSYASALEQAASGNGAFLAVLFELFIVITAGIIVGFFVIALFLPLIKLLNDLALIVWWLP